MKKLQIEDEVQHVGQTTMDTGSIQNIAEGAVTRKRRKKRKRIATEIEAEVECEMGTRNIADGNLTTKKPERKDEVQNFGLGKMDIGSKEVLAEGNVDIGNLISEDEPRSTYQTNLDDGQAQSIITESGVQQLKKKKRRKKAKLVDAVQKEILAEGNVDIENLISDDETRSTCQTNLDDGQAQSVITGSGAEQLKKKKRRKKAKPVDEVQKEMDPRSRDNLDKENQTVEKPKDKDEVQSLGLTQMNTGSTEFFVDGNVLIGNPKNQDETESMDHNMMDNCQLEENLARGEVAGKRRKKRNKNMAKVSDEVHSKMDSRSAEGNVTLSKPEIITLSKPDINNAIQSVAQTQIDTGSTYNVAEENVIVPKPKRRKKTKKAKVKDECSGNNDAGSTENLNEVNVNIRIPKIRDEVQIVGLKVNGAGSTENLTEGTLTFENEGQSIDKVKLETGTAIFFTKAGNGKQKQIIHAEENVTIENPKVQDEIQSTDQANLNSLMPDPSEVNVIVKRKKKRKRSKAQDKVESCGGMDAEPTKDLAEVNVDITIPETRAVPSIDLMDAVSTENLTEETLTCEDPKSKDEVQILNTLPALDVNAARKRRKKQRSKANIASEFPSASSGGTMSDAQLSRVHVEERAAISTCHAFTVKDTEAPSLNKAKVKVESCGGMDAEPIKDLAEVNVDITIPETREVPSIGLMNAVSTENLTKRTLTCEDPESKNEGEILNTLSAPDVNAARKRRKKRRSKANIASELPSASSGGTMSDAQLSRVHVVERAAISTCHAFTVKDTEALGLNKAKVKVESCGGMDAEPIKDLAEVNVDITIPETREVPSIGLMDAVSTETLTEGTLTCEDPKNKDEGQILNTLPALDVNVARKRRKKRRSKANIASELPIASSGGTMSDAQLSRVHVEERAAISTCHAFTVTDTDAEAVKDLAEVNVDITIPETREVPSIGLMDAVSTENLTERTLTCEDPKSKDEGEILNTLPAPDVNAARKRRKKRRSKANIASELPSASSGGTMSDTQLSSGHVEETAAISTCHAFTVNDTEASCLNMAPAASVRRKLLVLDINGLLADVVFPAPKHSNADLKIYGRAVFKRPFCGDFLNFCFQNFYVGIWSSRSKKIIDKVVSYLLGDQMDKLVFCWDMAHSTQTGFKTLENRHKPLVCKELRKVWEKDDPSWPWKKGDYNESNTLLLDDSPYKALLNPLHTAIFPHPFQYSDKNDKSLGPGGDLRVYLEGLAASENVQKYVEQHPFGQSAISEKDISWEFYERVLERISQSTQRLNPQFSQQISQSAQ